jgi:hypothetical protein
MITQGASFMITRRSAIAMVPAGLMVGSNFFNLASALAQEPAIRPDPDAARRILSGLDQWSKTPHYDATKPLIQFYSRVGSLRLAASGSKSKLNSKADLADALGQLNAIYAPVNTVLDIRKKSDDIIEGDKRRRLTPQEKTKLGSEIDIKNSKLSDIWTDLFSGSGDFDLSKVRNAKGGSATIDKLIALSDELLKASIELSKWGPDAFYAMARGYATFEFMRYCIRSSRSSPLLARAYTLKVISDSESYFSLRAASLTATAPTTSSTSTTPATTATAPAGSISANARYAVEKDMIDKRFPKEIYLGSELPNPENDCARGQIKNHYGKFTTDSSFDSSFKLEGSDGWSASACTAQLNDRGAEALNGLLGTIFKQFAPTLGTETSFKKTMRDTRDAMNDLARRLKAAKQREDGQTGQPTSPTTAPSGANMDAQQEFNVMQQMTSALREVLAAT